MPIPERIRKLGWDEISENDFLDRAEIKLMWSWLPRRCAITGEWLCFDLCYRARRIYTGPGEPVVEDRWYEKHNFLMLRLKGTGDV